MQEICFFPFHCLYLFIYLFIFQEPTFKLFISELVLMWVHLLQKISTGPVRWLNGQKSLLPGLATWVWYLQLTSWNKRINLWVVFSVKSPGSLWQLIAICNSSSKGITSSLLPSMSSRHTCRQNIHTHKIKIHFKIKYNLSIVEHHLWITAPEFSLLWFKYFLLDS